MLFNLKMNQEKAQVLFKEGAFLILLDVPHGTEFGIDWKTWTTAERFKGLKMIPPGIHFISYNAVSKFDGSIAPKTGFFYNFKQQEIVVKKYNKNLEMIEDCCLNDDELKNIKSNLQDLDRDLAAYPYDMLRKWVSMSNCITPQIISKISPLKSSINSAIELLPEPSTSNDKFGTTDKDGLPCMHTNPESAIRFSELPKRWYPLGASPMEISKHSMDSSYALCEFLQHYDQQTDILGELQYTFICFILGQVLDAFDHWKSLVHLLCSCEEKLPSLSDIYSQLISILYHQISEIPSDFFVDIVASNNFLLVNLANLFRSIGYCENHDELQDKAVKFKKYLSKKYKWKFRVEPEDCAPIVVEC